MSVVRDLILQADDQLRYPTGGELRSMVEFLSTGASRMSVVKALTENEKKIVDEAVQRGWSAAAHPRQASATAPAAAGCAGRWLP